MGEIDLGAAWTQQTGNLRSTHQFARRLAQGLSMGTVIGLIGELGAGKTSFVQGLAHGLGVTDQKQVLSPTYSLMNEYPIKNGTLVHIDFYRLNDEESARSLGLEEALARQDAVVAVEWADHLPGMMPPHSIWIKLTRISDTERQVSITGLPRPPGI